MKANEFRLGSLFGYKGCIYAANVIRDNFVYGKNVNGFAPGEFPLDKINPIPLTEEWLSKFGFEKSEKDKEGYQIWIFNGDECIFRIKHIIYFYLCDTNYFGTEIRYVHELQNLYFALTGQELTI